MFLFAGWVCGLVAMLLYGVLIGLVISLDCFGCGFVIVCRFDFLRVVLNLGCRMVGICWCGLVGVGFVFFLSFVVDCGYYVYWFGLGVGCVLLRSFTACCWVVCS